MKEYKKITSVNNLSELSTLEVLAIASELLEEALKMPALTEEQAKQYKSYKDVVFDFRIMWESTSELVKKEKASSGGELEFLDIDKKARSTAEGVIEYAMRTMHQGDADKGG